MPAKPTSGERLMLLDSASLYFRAFFGVPDERSDPDAPQNNAIRGLLDMIASLVTTHRPTHLVALLGQRLAAGVPGRGHPVVQGTPGRPGGAERRVEEEVPDPLEAQIRSSSTRSPRSASPGSAPTATRPTT